VLSFLIKPPAENRHHSGLHRVRVNQNIKRTGNPRKYMDVSENNGIPKSSILIGFSIINHPFWGKHPYFWKHPYGNCEMAGLFNLILVRKLSEQTPF